MQSSHYASLSDESGVATFIFDIEAHKVVYKNAAFDALFGAGKTGAQLDELKDIVHPDDVEYALACLSDLLKGRLDKHVHLRIRHAEGKLRWVRVMASVHTDSKQRRSVYGHAIDITTELTSQHTFAKYANKKNSILNILAHELSGSLGIARSLAKALKADLPDTVHNERIDKIMEINQQAVQLIRDLTNREFLETAEVKLVKKRVDIAKKLREYVEEAQKAEGGLRRSITFSSSPEEVFIRIDEPKFMQIINNLMSNALKFTAENGAIAFKIVKNADGVLFTVSDNGIGIPKKHHAILFDQYTAAGRPGLQGEPSMGLGMNVVKNIVEWHKGSIWFESAEGQGTTFYFEIPDKGV